MVQRVRTIWSKPVGRGFIMLAVMSFTFGFALNAHQNIVTNYFEEVLHFRGPDFGYMVAIREVPGFILIALTALFYRVSLQRVTAGALSLYALGLALFGLSVGFWTVVPWIVITSIGFHTVLQTQYALGMSLTKEEDSGRVLGQMAAVGQAGTLAALVLILIGFHFDLISFRPTFVVLGAVAFVGAIAIVRFPHLHEGEHRAVAPKRERMVWRREYRYFYLLNLLDGGRQQVFFAFGLWVLVNTFGLGVAQISAVLIAVTFVSMVSGTWIGRLIDRHGERRALSIVNVAYVIALTGFALADNVVLACLAYVLYSFILPISAIGSSTYLRRIALPEEVAPSLAMGISLLHATAIVVPLATGFILNYVGYQVPFYIAGAFAVATFFVTLRLDPETQRVAGRAPGLPRRGSRETAAEAEALLLAGDGGAGEEIASLQAVISMGERDAGE